MHFIGEIDIDKICNVGKKLVNNTVIITDERIKHIIEHHSDLKEYDIKQLSIILNKPDYIFEDRKNIDTLLYVRKIKDNGKIYRMVIKINTNFKSLNKFNSVISFWSISYKKLNQFIRNENIVYKNMDILE